MTTIKLTRQNITAALHLAFPDASPTEIESALTKYIRIASHEASASLVPVGSEIDGDSFFKAVPPSVEEILRVEQNHPDGSVYQVLEELRELGYVAWAGVSHFVSDGFYEGQALEIREAGYVVLGGFDCVMGVLSGGFEGGLSWVPAHPEFDLGRVLGEGWLERLDAVEAVSLLGGVARAYKTSRVPFPVPEKQMELFKRMSGVDSLIEAGKVVISSSGGGEVVG